MNRAARLALAAGSAVIVTSCGSQPSPDRIHTSDPVATIDAKASYLEGVELVRSDRPHDALPYFRAALAQRPDLWQIHADYAAALMNAAVATMPRRGMLIPSVRSTPERVAFVTEASGRFDRAEVLAPTANDRAFVLRHRATALAAWGLTWDAGAYEHRAKFEESAARSPIGP